jgi:hypothetical protein
MLPTTVVAGRLTVLVLDVAASFAAKRLGTSRLAGWGLLATIALWGLSNSDRRAKVQRRAAIVASAFSETWTTGEFARARLAAVFVDPKKCDALESHIAGALALASRPLLVREIKTFSIELATYGSLRRRAAFETPFERYRALLNRWPTDGNWARSDRRPRERPWKASPTSAGSSFCRPGVTPVGALWRIRSHERPV